MVLLLHLKVCWLLKGLITSLQSATPASKFTSRPTLSFFRLPFVFTCSSHWWTSIPHGPSQKQRSGALIPTGSIWTPHPLQVWWETWEPCSDWAWRWTLRCSFRAARGRMATKPCSESRAWLQVWHFCSYTTSLICPLILRLCFTYFHSVKVLQSLWVWLQLSLTVFTFWSEIRTENLFKISESALMSYLFYIGNKKHYCVDKTEICVVFAYHFTQWWFERVSLKK